MYLRTVDRTKLNTYTYVATPYIGRHHDEAVAACQKGEGSQRGVYRLVLVGREIPVGFLSIVNGLVPVWGWPLLVDMHGLTPRCLPPECYLQVQGMPGVHLHGEWWPWLLPAWLRQDGSLDRGNLRGRTEEPTFLVLSLRVTTAHVSGNTF